MLAIDHSPISADDYRVLLKRKQWTHADAGERFGVTTWTSKLWKKQGVPAGPAATVVRLALVEELDLGQGPIVSEAAAPVEHGNEAAGAGETVPAQPAIEAMAATLQRVEHKLEDIKQQLRAERRTNEELLKRLVHAAMTSQGAFAPDAAPPKKPVEELSYYEIFGYDADPEPGSAEAHENLGKEDK